MRSCMAAAPIYALPYSPAHTKLLGLDRLICRESDQTAGFVQAVCMMEDGRTWVPAKPWEQHCSSRWESDADSLSEAVKAHLSRLLDEAERADGPCRVES